MIGAHKLPIIDGEPTPAHGRRVSDQELIEVVRRCIPKLPNGLWPLPEVATDEALDPMIERRLGFCGGSGRPRQAVGTPPKRPAVANLGVLDEPSPGAEHRRGARARRTARCAGRSTRGTRDRGARGTNGLVRNNRSLR